MVYRGNMKAATVADWDQIITGFVSECSSRAGRTVGGSVVGGFEAYLAVHALD